MVYHGRKSQDEAITFCKKLNAGLPLPKNKGEEDEFLKITGSHLAFWIGLTDSTQSGNKAAWKDLEGNPIGNRYVNLRVMKFHSLLFLCVATDPTESGQLYHPTGVEKLHTI